VAVARICKGMTYDNILETGGHRGFFTWEESQAPPVHLRTPLMVRSHEVLTRCPAIQGVGQSQVYQRLVMIYPLE
jgi:hypothetical protein